MQDNRFHAVFNPQGDIAITYRDVVVTITDSAGKDGAVLVLVDTLNDNDKLRILLNNEDVFVGTPYISADCEFCGADENIDEPHAPSCLNNEANIAVAPCDECGARVDHSAELVDQKHDESCSLHNIGLGQTPAQALAELEDCDMCRGTRVLLDQTTGTADIPDGWIAVEACNCDSSLSDEDAAKIAAKFLGVSMVFCPDEDEEDDACDDDPDGVHHVGCGCDGHNDGTYGEYAIQVGDAERQMALMSRFYDGAPRRP